MSTVFSKIIAREIPAHIVYEDDLVIAFLDIMQATKGHTLVVTKEPFPDVFSVTPEVAAHFFEIVQKLSVAVKDAFHAPGLNILSNNGETAGQTVYHFHVHLIPRYEVNDIGLLFSNNMSKLLPEDYKERARLIKAALS